MNSSVKYNAGVFSSFLQQAASEAEHARWFVIDHDDEDDPHTLCCFMRMSYSKLIFFLDSCLLTDNYLGTSGPSSDKIEAFVKTIDDVEHTKCKMSFPGGLRRNYQFIRIGGKFPSLAQQIQNYTFTMMIKMEKNGTLPRLRRPRETRKHRLLHDAVEEYMEGVLDDYQSRFLVRHQQAKKVLFGAVDDQECDKEREVECEEEDPEDERYKESDKEQAVEQDVLLNGDTMKPVGLLDTPMKLKCGAKRISEDINLDEFLLLQKIVGRLSTDLEIRCLQRELLALSGVVKSVDLQEFVSRNDKSRRMILVPRSRSYAGFRVSARQTKWVSAVVDAIIPPSQSLFANPTTETEDNDDSNGYMEDEETEEHTSRHDAIKWLIIELGKMDPEVFTIAATTLGMPIQAAKLTAEEFMAMADEANFGLNACRVIRKHLLSKGANMLPSDREMRALGDKALIPVTKKVRIGNENVIYSYVPLDELVSEKLLERFDENVMSADIILGGDHGQGAFRSPVKIIMTFVDHKKTVECWFGEVECKKDNFEVIKGTLAGPMNMGLRRMMEKDVATGVSADGRFVVSKDSCSARYALKDEVIDTNLYLVIPLRFFLSGDLAFYAMSLGKEGSSGAHCYVCDSSKVSWQNIDHAKGDIWTLDKIQQVCTTILTPGQHVKGIVREPLITCIDVNCYMLPMMHIMMGIGNTLLDHFLDFIDRVPGLENVPMEIREARRMMYVAIGNKMDHEEAVTIWSHLDGTRLANFRVAKSVLSKSITKDRRNWSAEHLKLVEKDRKKMTDEIKELENQKKNLDAELTSLNKVVAETKRNVKVVEARYSMKDRELRAEIESCFLEPYGVGRGAHHGGDLTGPSVKALMANAGEIFDGLESYLMFRMDAVEAFPEELKEQVVARTRVYKNGLQNFDGVFSVVRSKNHEGSMETWKQKVKSFLVAALKCWRALKMSVTPKLHLLEDHLVDMLDMYGGLEDYDEEFVERAHQKGLKYNRMIKGCMRDATRRYTYLSRWEHARSKFKYEQIRDKIQESRKKKSNENDMKKQRKSKKLKQERDEARELGLEENKDERLDFDLLTVTELNLASLANVPDVRDDEAEEGWL